MMACARVLGTIARASLLKAALKWSFQLGKEPFRLEVVAKIEFGPRAPSKGKRDQRGHKGAHYFFSRRKTSKTPTKAITAAAIALNCSGSIARPTAEARANRPE